MRLKHLLLVILSTAIWGVNFSSIKLGLESLDAFTLNAVRFFLIAVPLVFFVKKPDIKLYLIAAYGLLFGVGLWGMVSWSIHLGVSAGVASLVLQMSAFLTILWGYLFVKEKVDNGQIIGGVLALVGLLLIAQLTDGSVTYQGLTVILFAVFNLSIAVLMLKLLKVKQVFAFLVWSSLFSPIPLIIIAYLTHGAVIFTEFSNNLTSTAVFSIAFQVYPATLLAYWIWNKMVLIYPISLLAPISLLIAIFGFISSYFMYGEEIGSLKLLACGLIVCGLIISVYGVKIWSKLSINRY